MTYLPRALFALLVGGLTSTLSAENVIVVDWDGSGTEGTQPLQLEQVPSRVTTSAYNLLLDESVSLMPAQGYLPPSDKTEAFSLAISSSAGPNPAAPTTLQLDPRSGGGTLTIVTSGSLDQPPQMSGLLVFPKPGFLNGAEADSAKVHFDKNSQLYFMGILDGMAPEARWLVRDNDTWYVSEVTLEAQATYNVSEARQLVDPQSIKWAEYSIDTPLASAPTGYALRTFDNVTAVGILWNSYGDRPVLGATSISRVAVDVFSVEAVK